MFATRRKGKKRNFHSSPNNFELSFPYPSPPSKHFGARNDKRKSMKIFMSNDDDDIVKPASFLLFSYFFLVGHTQSREWNLHKNSILFTEHAMSSDVMSAQVTFKCNSTYFLFTPSLFSAAPKQLCRRCRGNLHTQKPRKFTSEHFLLSIQERETLPPITSDNFCEFSSSDINSPAFTSLSHFTPSPLVRSPARKKGCLIVQRCHCSAPSRENLQVRRASYQRETRKKGSRQPIATRELEKNRWTRGGGERVGWEWVRILFFFFSIIRFPPSRSNSSRR